MKNSTSQGPGKIIISVVCGALLLVAVAGGFMLAGKSSLSAARTSDEAQMNTAQIESLTPGKFSQETGGVTTAQANRAAINSSRDGRGMAAVDGAAQDKSSTRDANSRMPPVNDSQAAIGNALARKSTDAGPEAGSLRKLPDSLLLYPGLQPVPAPPLPVKDGMNTGMITGWTDDSVKAVTAYYTTKFQESGFSVEALGMFDRAEAKGGTLAAKAVDGKTSISVVLGQEAQGKTHVTVQYEEPK